jgi:OmcA/MtrC family decaheme c-type cytochrome
VSDAKCSACHEQLGTFTEESFHAGQRNDGNSCSWCHNPNRTSSGWSADSTSFVHAIHGASKRTKPFTWHAATTTSSYDNVGYPAVLANCETCHVAGTYDFSNSALNSLDANGLSVVDKRLYRYVGVGKYDGTVAGSVAKFSISPYVVADNVKNYGAGFAFNATTAIPSNITKADGTVFVNPPQGIFNAEGTTLVNSPITTACFSCHDSTQATNHMTINGGSIYAPRATALANPETCLVCHGTGRVADIKAMHAK